MAGSIGWSSLVSLYSSLHLFLLLSSIVFSTIVSSLFQASLWSNNRSGEQACTAYVMFKDSYSQETKVLLTVSGEQHVEWFIAHSKEPDFEQYKTNPPDFGSSFVLIQVEKSVLPGLSCLQKDFPCNRGKALYSEFSINCGGPPIRFVSGALFEREDEELGLASFVGMFPQVVLMLNTKVKMSSFITSLSVFSLHLLLLLMGLFLNPVISDPRGETVAQMCNNRTMTPQQKSLVVTNFLAAMDAVSPLLEAKGYGQVVNGTGNLTVYAYGECMKDLDKKDCDLCFAQIKAKVPRCLPFQQITRGGRVFSDGCYEITGVNRTLFRDNAAELVKFMSEEAVRNGGFYAGFVDKRNVTVHGLAQCWEPLTRSGCVECLSKASEQIGSCFGNEEGRALNAGCHNHLVVILAVTCSVVAFVLLVSAVGFLYRKKRAKKLRENKQLGPLFMLANKSNICFSYENLEKATDYFSDKNKLGQGGSGSVFKGVLRNGKNIAVKRLFFNTKQWVDHFFNEVNLISQIDHKNLVKLLGCSITGPESLLVYEYIANKSLHDYLFVRQDVPPLDWAKRFKILLGTAEGMAYLHEESNLRIIHRDIKLSNILLEHDFTPRIADFGLARLFPGDKTHISTAIAGTRGYMAPEYAVRGKLTEKADVYSFGVVMIEVITGRRNSAFSQDATSILQTVWSLYGTSNLAQVVDQVLGDNFNKMEASRLLEIGLLCVQAAFEQRPAMSAVVKMMKGNMEIPTPKQPPFLDPGSVLEARKMMSPTMDSPMEDQSQSSGWRSDNISETQKGSKQHKNILNRSPLKVSPTPKPTRHVKNTCLRFNCETNTCHHNPTSFPPPKPSSVSPESPWFTCIFHGQPPFRLSSTPYFHFWRASIDLFEISSKKANPTNQNTMTTFISNLSLLLLVGLFLNPVISDSRGETVAQRCSNRTTTPQQRSLVVTNFLAAMDAVSPLVEAKGYGQVVNGTGNLTVYAYGECMKDLDKKDCDLCFAQIKAKVPRCLPFQRGTRGGRVFSDGCFIRYDEYNFFNETLSSQDVTNCSNKEITGVNRTLFRDNAGELVKFMSVEAVRNGGFYAGFVERRNVTAHGLAQCWEPLTRSGCAECLSNASEKIGSCLGKEEGRVLNAGCYMRFSNLKFYNNSGNSTSDGNGGHNHLAVILAVTSSVVAFVLLVSAVGFLYKKKRAKKLREKKQLGSLFMLANKSDLSFSYENLERATDYFSNKNKLGQGGSGSVFKGVLSNGKTVAVKRLFFNTKQWVDHFFNEVNLISQIDHKNLVKLLGCSITGPESLLVYEYIANQSLHDYLFVIPLVKHRGYMAPEYVVRGKLTEKADVYSFGVLMIEVITGRRNNAFSQDSSSILQTVWSLYGTSNFVQVVDPVLGDNFNKMEASRLLEIGLLCVQAAFDQRPAMSAVVKMMKGSLEIPTPTQPPFLNPGSVLEMRKMMSPMMEDQSQSSGWRSDNISEKPTHHRYLPCLFLFLLSLLRPITSDPRARSVKITCSPQLEHNETVFVPNFVASMEKISQVVQTTGFGTAQTGSGPDGNYALAQCYGDLPLNDCVLCYAEARTILPKCYPQNGGRIFLDGCFMRAENYSFYKEVKGPEDTVLCGNATRRNNATFGDAVRQVVRNAVAAAPGNGGYARGASANGESSAFVLVNCWRNLSPESCKQCLEDASASMVDKCLPWSEGRSVVVIVVSVLSSVIVFMVGIAIGVYICKNRTIQKKRRGSNDVEKMAKTLTDSSLNFKYSTLEKATGSFDNANKLGQGGFGTVYKGVLPDGRDIAVKRLFFNNRHRAADFYNEVNIISSVEHKNLVRLLGCSCSGPESLLVYEYLQNKSLDRFIFDVNRGKTLDWPRRFVIIVGTAEGLVYLHEQSSVKIIHRDIKASNILLDSKLQAKIADFGLARSFQEDKSHISTAIAGTLGYMAPEYLAHGQLTEKVDVYSFGVLVLEIVTGKQNTKSKMSDYSDSLITEAWKHFQTGELEEIYDPNLDWKNQNDSLIIKKEIVRVVQIGLLCTQEMASLRPSMSKVLHMLKHKEEVLPLPSNPPFMDERVMEFRYGSDGDSAACASLATVSQSSFYGR
ncbi:hypothetical protein HID58_072943 [Brassica napus]|uniref:Cysteine-rich receptor-like protein kinase 2 n=1 Tax=Brassica napus TaxID=3708 RepID=A0ABQ7Z5U7_BRANA|nr:hypothetical protein HID58_072943 [Brassica napus]